MRFPTIVLLLLAFARSASAADEWPQFRGPEGQGHADAKGLPTAWSETQNIVWKTAIAGKGYSSPVIGRGLVWMTTALEDGKSLCVVAVDAKTGAIVRQREVMRNDSPPPVNLANSHASPSTVLEGDRLYVHYGTSGTAAISTVSDETLWVNQDLKLDHHEGPGSSPIIWHNLLIVNCDGRDVQYVIALDKNTGKTVWKTNRSGEMHPDVNERKAFCTPLVIDVNDQPLLISPAAKRVMAYDPANGQEKWVVQYAPGYSNVPRPVFGHGMLFICTGYMKPELWAIRPDGSGDITQSHVVWKVTQNAPANPSPVLLGNELYIVSDNGIASCINALTGEVHWRQRLGDNYWASPLLADGKIYFWDEGGETVVIEPGTTFKQLARNKLADGFKASPAVLDSALIVRTVTHLYRIQDMKRAATVRSQTESHSN